MRSKRQLAKTLRAIPDGCARWAHKIIVGDPAEAIEREAMGPVGQDRTAVVGAFGVPSVACEKAGTKVRFWHDAEAPGQSGDGR
jgi:hypothetical protein